MTTKIIGPPTEPGLYCLGMVGGDSKVRKVDTVCVDRIKYDDGVGWDFKRMVDHCYRLDAPNPAAAEWLPAERLGSRTERDVIVRWQDRTGGGWHVVVGKLAEFSQSDKRFRMHGEKVFRDIVERMQFCDTTLPPDPPAPPPSIESIRFTATHRGSGEERFGIKCGEGYLLFDLHGGIKGSCTDQREFNHRYSNVVWEAEKQ